MIAGDFVGKAGTSFLRAETFQIVYGIILPIPKAERLQPNRHFGPPLTLAGASRLNITLSLTDVQHTRPELASSIASPIPDSAATNYN